MINVGELIKQKLIELNIENPKVYDICKSLDMLTHNFAYERMRDKYNDMTLLNNRLEEIDEQLANALLVYINSINDIVKPCD